MTTPAPAPRGTFLRVMTPILAILALVIGGLFLVKSQVTKKGVIEDGNGAEIQIGSVLPDFKVKRFGGGEIQASSLKAKILLVNFWATWCEACMVEMPSLVKLRSQYVSKGFDLLAINVEDNPASVLPKALKEFHIDFPVYLDSESKLSDLFDIHAIPLTVIMDQNRKILLIENGGRDWDTRDIHQLLDRWLAT